DGAGPRLNRSLQRYLWQLPESSSSVNAAAALAYAATALDALLGFEAREGVESHLAVNVVGTVLLTCLLLPKMKESAARTGLRGRLTVVGSDMMYMADTRELQTDGSIIAKLNDQAQSQIKQRYPLSKVLVFYSLRELAGRSPLNEASDVILSVLTPGACKSDIFRDDTGALGRMFMGVAMAALSRSTEVGGRTLVFGVSPDLSAEAHGRFLMDNKIAP
ncbi:hypothetical protein B0A55_07647, partial [Friedmanniomyces simplex]